MIVLRDVTSKGSDLTRSFSYLKKSGLLGDVNVVGHFWDLTIHPNRLCSLMWCVHLEQHLGMTDPSSEEGAINMVHLWCYSKKLAQHSLLPKVRVVILHSVRGLSFRRLTSLAFYTWWFLTDDEVLGHGNLSFWVFSMACRFKSRSISSKE